MKELGGKLVDVQQFILADGAYTRNLAVIEKIKDTPKNIRAKQELRKRSRYNIVKAYRLKGAFYAYL